MVRAVPPARSKAPIVVAVVVGLVLIAAVRSWVGGGGKHVEGTPHKNGCTLLTMVASSEKAALVTTMAESYNKGDHEAGGHCVEVKVVSKASGGAAEALAKGWEEAVDGPRPDV